MNSASTYYTNASTATVPILLPGRVKLWGMQISAFLNAGTAESNALVQVSLNGQLQNQSATMANILGQLTLYAIVGAGMQAVSDSISIPFQKPWIVSDRIYVHNAVSGGMRMDIFVAAFYEQ